MNIKEMHYDFKIKFNKIDSQQNRNLLVPEIDWLLNQAQELFIKMVAFPRYNTKLGFEKVQRNTDDIRPLLRNRTLVVDSNKSELPKDYWHYINGNVIISKGKCKNKLANIFIQQHDDNFETSPFDKSSFEWREVNATFIKNYISFHTDNSFEIESCKMLYIKKPNYIHNAEDFFNSSYALPSGSVLNGIENCELPDHTHREIVDLAVLLATEQIQVPDYQLRLQKLNLNNLN